MAEDWTIQGDYVEACNCDVACQCIWLEPPNDDVCTASLAWHIQDGRYGDVDLSDLSVGMLISTEEGVMFGPETGWDVVLFVDEEADEQQHAAVEDIYFGRAGGIWAAVADTHVRSADVVSAPIDFDRDGTEFSVEIGDVVSMDADALAGFNDEVGSIFPHPLTSDHEMAPGKSSTAVASYDDTYSWDVSGGNSYLGDFQLTNA